MLKIFCDGGSRGNPGHAASAFVALNEKGEIIKKHGEYLGITTNNVAEYSTVIFAMGWLVKDKVNQEIVFHLDSQLIVNQLLGIYKIKDTKLASLATKVKTLEKSYPQKITYKHIPREQNKIADLLVNEVLDKRTHSEKSNIKCV